MNRHLSPEQFSEWTLGGRDFEAVRHVEECSECRTELARCQDALVGFRDAVHEFGAEKLSASFQIGAAQPNRSQLNRSQLNRWISLGNLSGALGVVAVCAILGVSSLHREAPSSRASGNGAITDATLLAQIDTELSRAVPCPMEPLTQLVDWQTAAK